MRRKTRRDFMERDLPKPAAENKSEEAPWMLDGWMVGWLDVGSRDP